MNKYKLKYMTKLISFLYQSEKSKRVKNKNLKNYSYKHGLTELKINHLKNLKKLVKNFL